MDHSEELDNVESGKSGKSAGKRCWREIEALKEKRRLQAELEEYGYAEELDDF
ncbi:DUF3545 domain-containing protein [Pseudidiomarina aestuarii]|uniref:DUF3545 domain-containing protein n=1 Tax=Pseudidiomarina aestuarii TaxID=624146 RepID=A0A2T4CNA6_9GAMM|nr:DUF3545 family protein [Pseudidiomarina aestuarii]PTB83059.1 DUF3545 domain-containing protein [Pseudidiomarina aestuarii]RUO41697.1 DUF3545 domain-containing protein [Pseudidiomarina aestuarii]